MLIYFSRLPCDFVLSIGFTPYAPDDKNYLFQEHFACMYCGVVHSLDHPKTDPGSFRMHAYQEKMNNRDGYPEHQDLPQIYPIQFSAYENLACPACHVQGDFLYFQQKLIGRTDCPQCQNLLTESGGMVF